MDNSVKERLVSKDLWFRVLFIVVFFVVAYWPILALVFGVIALLQLVFWVLKDKPEQNVSNIGQGLCAFVCHILRYITFITNEKPYPFTSWPGPSKEERPE